MWRPWTKHKSLIQSRVVEKPWKTSLDYSSVRSDYYEHISLLNEEWSDLEVIIAKLIQMEVKMKVERNIHRNRCGPFHKRTESVVCIGKAIYQV